MTFKARVQASVLINYDSQCASDPCFVDMISTHLLVYDATCIIIT